MRGKLGSSLRSKTALCLPDDLYPSLQRDVVRPAKCGSITILLLPVSIPPYSVKPSFRENTRLFGGTDDAF